jgi:hypothetical protein
MPIIPIQGLSLLPPMDRGDTSAFGEYAGSSLAAKLIEEADWRVSEALAEAANVALELMERWVADEQGLRGLLAATFHGPRGLDVTDDVWFVGSSGVARIRKPAPNSMAAHLHSTLGSVASKALGADLSGPMIVAPSDHLLATLVWDDTDGAPQILDALRVLGPEDTPGRISALDRDAWGWLELAEEAAPEAFAFRREQFFLAPPA